MDKVQAENMQPCALCFLGVKAVLAKSFERIHSANLVNFGILPLVFVNPSDYDKVSKDDNIVIDEITNALEEGKNIIVQVPDKDIKIEARYDLTKRQIDIISAGGLLNYTKSTNK